MVPVHFYILFYIILSKLLKLNIKLLKCCDYYSLVGMTVDYNDYKSHNKEVFKHLLIYTVF